MPESHVHAHVPSSQAVGGFVAIFLFILTLAAFVIQSSLTQYVQGTLGFRQPFFLLYVAHSSLLLIFPIHLSYLVVKTRSSIRSFLHNIHATLMKRFSPPEHGDLQRDVIPIQRDVARFFGVVLLLTIGINVPALLWYAAVSLASIGDVTAIWNTNSFWVYVLTVKLYRMKWQPLKLCAVILACFGVILDVYGGSKSLRSPDDANVLDVRVEGPTSPLLGDALTLVASLSYALYQVLYKRYVALPGDDHGEGYDAPPYPYERLSDTSTSTPSLTRHVNDSRDEDPTELPFGLYYNFITSCIGLCTFLTFAIGFPILHWLSIERFTIPPNMRVLGCVIGIAVGGVTFNSCLMILLGLWGPILTSVGNLLTIVLVLITDFLFNGVTITLWSLLGAGMILAAFGVLVLDMIHHPK